jgi:hypothetical protein
MRTDLLSLSLDALEALANRGLVKRAGKEPAPELTVVDGTVRGTFADGVETTLPPGVALGMASCSCSAAGMCRHRIAVVLAYQQLHAAPEFTPWSPGDIGDPELVAFFGERVIASARRLWRAGYAVTLTRPTPQDPVATAELPSCTVRFLVPGELGHVHTDAAKRDELIVLAVWAFREADERGLSGRFDVGNTALTSGSALQATIGLVDELLTDGAAHTSPILLTALRNAERHLTEQNLHWPAAAVNDLVTQLDAYHSRSARYSPVVVAELITELHARNRAIGPRSQVLGTDEPGETPLRLVRLIALGCRVHPSGAEVFFAGNGNVLVLRQDMGPRTRQLAASNVVSESAVRTASRTVRLASNRVAKTSITPVGSAWESLPDTMLVRDFAAMANSLALLPPRVVRARIEAELVRVLQISEVQSINYRPGAQRLDALVADSSGTTATISSTFRGICPGALDALAAALRDSPRLVSGSVRRTHGSLVIDPIAVLTESGVVIPDLVSDHPKTLLGDLTIVDESIVDTALETFGSIVHSGLNRIPPSVLTRLGSIEAELRRTGLRATASHVSAFLATPTNETWFNAHIRLVTLTEVPL